MTHEVHQPLDCKEGTLDGIGSILTMKTWALPEVMVPKTAQDWACMRLGQLMTLGDLRHSVVQISKDRRIRPQRIGRFFGGGKYGSGVG